MLNRIVLLSVLALYVFTARATITLSDDKGNKVQLIHPAQRIVSLAPHITESLFAAGAGQKIIATVSYSDYPEAAKKITRVGGYPSLDLEKIISLKPDLIIAWASGNNQDQIARLKTLGFPIYMSEPRQPLEIARNIRNFGLLAGTSEVADKTADAFVARYKKLEQQYARKKKVRVFYQVWHKPIMTVSGKHLISKIIHLCGGSNVFAELSTLTPQVSLESVLLARPQVIVSGGMGKSRPDWLDAWKKWPQLPAVKNGHLYYIDPSIMQRVGPRILQGAEQLCQFLEYAR